MRQSLGLAWLSPGNPLTTWWCGRRRLLLRAQHAERRERPLSIPMGSLLIRTGTLPAIATEPAIRFSMATSACRGAPAGSPALVPDTLPAPIPSATPSPMELSRPSPRHHPAWPIIWGCTLTPCCTPSEPTTYNFNFGLEYELPHQVVGERRLCRQPGTFRPLAMPIRTLSIWAPSEIRRFAVRRPV